MDDKLRAIKALFSIDPDLPREEWIDVGMSVLANGLEFEAFDKWSSGGTKYDPDEARKAWNSFGPGKIGPGTLFHYARRYGWSDTFIEAEDEFDVIEPPSGKILPKNNPEALWDEFDEAEANHPYIVSKKGVPEGLKVVPLDHELKINGINMAGALAVPCRTPQGYISSLQFITPTETAKKLRRAGKPTKLNLPGHSLIGWFSLGDLHEAKRVYVVEGIGQSWAIHSVTSDPVVSSFGSGRTKNVAQQLRSLYEDTEIVIVPDVGKEKGVLEVARLVGAKVALLPEGEESNFDCNDFLQREGDIALLDILSGARSPESRYKLLNSEDLKTLPPMDWCVDGVLPSRGLASIFGQPSTGKSFLALDLAAAIGEGDQWFGYSVKNREVVFVALEGESGVRNRVEAWEVYNMRAFPPDVQFVIQPFNFASGADLSELATVLPKGAVVFIDTLNRAAPGADENSSRDMGNIIAGAKRLADQIEGLVVLIHHQGKNQDNGLRGHSSLLAALDLAIVVKSGPLHRWEVSKNKDGNDSIQHKFELHRVFLGFKESSEISSCVVVPKDTADGPVKKLPSGKHQKRIYAKLRDLLEAVDQNSQPSEECIPEGKPYVELVQVFDDLQGSLSEGVDEERKSSRVNDAVKSLVSAGWLCREGDFIWLP
jgi:putative DNA primase/helicase